MPATPPDVVGAAPDVASEASEATSGGSEAVSGASEAAPGASGGAAGVSAREAAAYLRGSPALRPMLTSLRIQNFRSIRDASVKLGQVNLFIGPNNSGKSNFLKGIELLAFVLINPKNRVSYNKFEAILFRSVKPRVMYWGEDDDSIIFDLEATELGNHIVKLNTRISIEPFTDQGSDAITKTDAPDDLISRDRYIRMLLSIANTVIYKADPSKFQSSYPIVDSKKVDADTANLVSFLFYLSQNHKSQFRKLEKDLSQCIGNLVSISTPADPDEPGKLKLKFFDNEDRSYWADEVSEGVLYFLALLCIVHQPDPPKLLLLEEPEKGIHPRRIREVMDFIFELARLRNIQIILTSHSPYVVDHFKDIPECISVFDRENGETVIRNAGDLIREKNEEYAAQGLPPVQYSDSLGQYWVSGFLGGVPL
jgi:AAA15 family ATPase/GTPase